MECALNEGPDAKVSFITSGAATLVTGVMPRAAPCYLQDQLFTGSMLVYMLRAMLVVPKLPSKSSTAICGHSLDEATQKAARESECYAVLLVSLVRGSLIFARTSAWEDPHSTCRRALSCMQYRKLVFMRHATAWEHS